MRVSTVLASVGSIAFSGATLTTFDPRDADLQAFNADDPASLLLGLPVSCVADPVANEHICMAWQQGIMKHNLLENITAIWTAERPSYFPTIEENAADQADLDAMSAFVIPDEMEAVEDEDDASEEGEQPEAATTLEKRRKHPKHSTTTAAPEETGKHHKGKKKPHKTTSHKPKHTKSKKKKPHKTTSAETEPTGKHGKDKKLDPTPCPCCYNEKRILCCVTSPLWFNVPCCLKQQKHCHKENFGINQAKCLCSGLDDCKKQGYWKKVTKPKC